MKTIRSQSLDPTFNLSMEEYWLKHAVLDDDLFYLWRNNPAIVIGRNQNPYREIALWKAYQDQVPVIRRISGGGTVYHDPGNVNFTFVTSNFKGNINNYKAFLDPIEKALNQMGIPVRFQGKSDLYLGEKKVSGNAQSFHQNRLIHHGTLLFDADLSKLSDYLHGKIPETTGPSVVSNRASVGQIRPVWPKQGDVLDFCDDLFLAVEAGLNVTLETRRVEAFEIAAIAALAAEKYATFEWNYGETPPFSKRILEPSGKWTATLEIENGRIDSVDSDWPEWMGLEGEKMDIDALRKRLRQLGVVDVEAFLARIFD